MARHKKITDALRKEIYKLHAQGLGRNAIAKKVGRANATVTKICGQHDPPLEFDRRKTVVASAAKAVDLKAIRQALEADLLADAIRLREQLWQPCIAFNFGGKDNTYNSTNLEQPLFADQTKIMQALSIATTASLKLAAVDANSADLPAVDAWLAAMTGENHED